MNSSPRELIGKYALIKEFQRISLYSDPYAFFALKALETIYLKKVHISLKLYILQNREKSKS